MNTNTSNITEFVKTATFIMVETEDGLHELIDRKEFEQYADLRQWREVSSPNPDCESCAEDSRLLSWDEYYKTNTVTDDLAVFIEMQRKVRVSKMVDEILAPIKHILEC